jgi:hypothetical protein
MAYTKKTIAIALIAFTALLCAVIIPSKNSRQDKSSGSSQSTATVSATSNQEAVPAMLSDFPSMTPSAVPSSLSLPEKRTTALPSDYPSGIPSKIPTSAPIPLSDYPSIVPSSWGTPEPTLKRDRWLTEDDMVHGQRVRALREH